MCVYVSWATGSGVHFVKNPAAGREGGASLVADSAVDWSPLIAPHITPFCGCSASLSL